MIPEAADPANHLPQGIKPNLLHERINGWFMQNARDLPWRRDDCSPWGVMVSEFMLQQTPVKRVLPVWEEWMRRWPTPADLAAEPASEAVRAWGRLGYPRRAQRLHGAAVAIVERHDGKVPADHDALLDLPGVGSYTAAAISVFAFGLRETVIDTNIRRVHARAVSGKALPSRSLTAAETRLAEALMPADTPTSCVWNAATMELGALVCTAKSPTCELCPVQDVCAWIAAGRPEAEYTPRGQAWHGTDRQVRGAVMAVLRGPRARGAQPHPGCSLGHRRCCLSRPGVPRGCSGRGAPPPEGVVRALPRLRTVAALLRGPADGLSGPRSTGGRAGTRLALERPQRALERANARGAAPNNRYHPSGVYCARA